MPLFRRHSQTDNELSRSLEIPNDVHADKTAGAVREPALEEFLEKIAAGLRSLPGEVTHDMRTEMLGHIESLVAAREELGEDRETAVASALRQLGDPALIAKRFRTAWNTSGRNKNVGAAKDIVISACWAVLLAFVWKSLLHQWVSMAFLAEKGAAHGFAQAPEFIGLPLLAQVPYLIPILVGRGFGRRWAETGDANARFWLTLATGIIVLSSAEQFLQWGLLLGVHMRPPNYETVRIFEDLFRQMVPLGILSAIFARQRRVSRSISPTILAGVAFSVWLLVMWLDTLNGMAYSPVSPKTLVLHAIENWSIPCMAVAAVLWMIFRKRDVAPTSGEKPLFA